MAATSPERPLEVLYVCYDGLLEPLGRSQIVRYLEGLAGEEVRLRVLSFEKRQDLRNREQCASLHRELEARGIEWRRLPYHKRPRLLATAFDIARGTAAGLALVRECPPDVVHVRSYVAGLMGLAFRAVSNAHFVFDMRGFWPEERVELGLFRARGFLHRTSKLLETRLLDAADHVVVLTENAKSILREREANALLHQHRPRSHEVPMSVIPCCVDLERFQPLPPDRELAARHDLESSVVIGNVGAFNQRYLVHEMFRFACHLKTHRPDLRFVYLTEQDPRAVRRVAKAAGFPEKDLRVLRAEPDDVPRWLSLFRLGVFFLRPSYAAKASSFTKLGELLAAGVPAVTNTGVGDLDRLLGSERNTGFLLPGLTDRELSAFARLTLPFLEGDRVSDEVRESCRAAAARHFSLADGVARYRSLYRSLGPASTSPAGSPATAGAR